MLNHVWLHGYPEHVVEKHGRTALAGSSSVRRRPVRSMLPGEPGCVGDGRQPSSQACGGGFFGRPTEMPRGKGKGNKEVE